MAISDGYGRHLYYLAENAAPAIKISLVAFIFGIVSVGIPKLAVTCLLIRLLNPTRRHVIILYSLSISCIVVVSLCAVFLWTQCHPVAALWDPSLVPICWNPTILVTYSILAGGKTRRSRPFASNSINRTNSHSRILTNQTQFIPGV